MRLGRRLLNPLREGAGAAGSRAQQRAHSVLIVVQIALALVLLAGASIFVRTYAGIRSTTLGYDAAHLMTARVFFAGKAYDAEPARTRVVEELARRLKTLPGAHAATVTDLVPLDDQGGTDAKAAVEGRVFDEGQGTGNPLRRSGRPLARDVRRPLSKDERSSSTSWSSERPSRSSIRRSCARSGPARIRWAAGSGSPKRRTVRG